MRPFLLLATILTFIPTASAAQVAGRAPRVLQLPASTRAMALGDAYMLDAGHADGIFYNPALTRGAQGFGLGVQTWSGEATSASLSAAMAWSGGSVGLGLQTLQYGVASPDLSRLPAGQDALFARGAEGASERVATLAYARTLFGVEVGVGAKLLEERVGVRRDAALALDVGLTGEVGVFEVGLSAQNLGDDLELGADDDEAEVPLPARVTLGVGGYGQPLGPLDVGLSGAVTYEDGETFVGAGLEVGYWPVRGRTFVGRIGVRRVPEGDASPLSLGAAFWGDDLVLEWAWQSFGGAVDDATHRFGVRWR